MNWIKTFWQTRRTVQLWAMLLGAYTAFIGFVYLIDPVDTQRLMFLWSGAATLTPWWPTVLAGIFIAIGVWMLVTATWSLRILRAPSMATLTLWGYATSLYLISWPESWWMMLLVPVPALLSAMAIRVRCVVGHHAAHAGTERHMRIVSPLHIDAG